jgi:hypothetical protein
MSWIDELMVGDTVWRVGFRMGTDGGNNGESRTVAKVGRKWIYTQVGWQVERFDGSGMADGGKYSSPAVYYKDESSYLTEKESKSLWHEFRDQVYRRHSMPRELSAESIRQAAMLLGLTLTKGKDWPW